MMKNLVALLYFSALIISYNAVLGAEDYVPLKITKEMEELAKFGARIYGHKQFHTDTVYVVSMAYALQQTEDPLVYRVGARISIGGQPDQPCMEFKVRKHDQDGLPQYRGHKSCVLPPDHSN